MKRFAKTHQTTVAGFLNDHGGYLTDNMILTTDSYKLSHYRQYPPRTEYVYSYFESRGGAWNEVVFFGLQYALKISESRVICKTKSTKRPDASRIAFWKS